MGKHISDVWQALVDFFFELIPVLAVCVTWLLAVLADAMVLGTRCSENSLVEWLQFVLILSSAVIMVIMTVRVRNGRAAFILASALFLDMAIREQDANLDDLIGHGNWSWLVAVVTIAAFAVMLRPCWRTTFVEGLAKIKSSRWFQLLPIGMLTTIVIARIMGMKHLWSFFGMGCELRLARRMTEESLELFGYGLIFAWALLFWREYVRRT